MHSPHPRWSVSSPGYEAQYERSVLRTDFFSTVVLGYAKVPSWTYTISLFKRKSYKNW